MIFILFFSSSLSVIFIMLNANEKMSSASNGSYNLQSLIIIFKRTDKWKSKNMTINWFWLFSSRSLDLLLFFSFSLGVHFFFSSLDFSGFNRTRSQTSKKKTTKHKPKWNSQVKTGCTCDLLTRLLIALIFGLDTVNLFKWNEKERERECQRKKKYEEREEKKKLTSQSNFN